MITMIILDSQLTQAVLLHTQTHLSMPRLNYCFELEYWPIHQQLAALLLDTDLVPR